MVTTRQIAANRLNAQRSTGPSTAEGKSRARMNAVKHGLSTPSSSLPKFFDNVAQLADAIAGASRTDPAIWAAAVAVAAAEWDVRRARDVRRAAMGRLLSEDPIAGEDGVLPDETWGGMQPLTATSSAPSRAARPPSAPSIACIRRSSRPTASATNFDFGRTNPMKGNHGCDPAGLNVAGTSVAR